MPPIVIIFILDSECLSSGQHVCSESPKQKVADAYLCLAMCASNCKLAATSLGINTCILTPKQELVAKLLSIKSHPIPLMIGFGYELKGAFKRKRERKKLSELIFKS